MGEYYGPHESMPNDGDQVIPWLEAPDNDNASDVGLMFSAVPESFKHASPKGPSQMSWMLPALIVLALALACALRQKMRRLAQLTAEKQRVNYERALLAWRLQRGTNTMPLNIQGAHEMDAVEPAAAEPVRAVHFEGLEPVPAVVNHAQTNDGTQARDMDVQVAVLGSSSRLNDRRFPVRNSTSGASPYIEIYPSIGSSRLDVVCVPRVGSSAASASGSSASGSSSSSSASSAPEVHCSARGPRWLTRHAVFSPVARHSARPRPRLPKDATRPVPSRALSMPMIDHGLVGGSSE